MIRARGKLEKGLCRRWFGPTVAVILVVLVLLIGLHPVADQFVEHAALTCAVIALVGLIAIPTVAARPRTLDVPPARARSLRSAALPVARVCLADGQGSFPLRR